MKNPLYAKSALCRKKAWMVANAPAYYCYRTPYGYVTIRAEERGVTNVAFGEVNMEGNRKPSELSNRAATELLEYFAGKRHVFDVPLAPQGTAFQRAVWDELTRTPYGQARTNAQVAEALGRASSYRAVGTAVRQNPLAVLVPDHRIIGAGGKAPGVDKAAQLRNAFLELERRNMSATGF